MKTQSFLTEWQAEVQILQHDSMMIRRRNLKNQYHENLKTQVGAITGQVFHFPPSQRQTGPRDIRN